MGMKQDIGTKKTTPLGGRIWVSAIVFGLVGQIAWVVENMYFATFAQDIFQNSGRTDMSYLVTTLMVWLSEALRSASFAPWPFGSP